MKIAHVFVYGTLKRGYDNPFARRLHAEAAFETEGYVVGKKIQISWYPGLLLGDPYREKVYGELFRLPEQQEKLLAFLDKYEGVSQPPKDSDEYLRVGRTVFTQSGEIRCWIYQFIGKHSDA